MSDPIQRVLYYDREYLRGFDFTAEQIYHLEMRRRLNVGLHLQGIASGLELMLVAGTDDRYCVNPGMAIDGYGREIVLSDRYILSDDDFRTAHIAANGKYAVCIAYDREPATPPSAGYSACGVKDQYTRWTERPTIQILDDLPDLPDPPLPSDPPPDDPKTHPWPVFLGWVYVSVSAGGAVGISKIITVARQRQYVGVRAQRLIAPSAPPPAPAGGPTPDPAIYIDAVTPITVESDLQEEKTLIIGNDFKVDKSKVMAPTDSAPTDPNFPGPAGNLKVEKGLFVLGDLYKAVDDKWYPLAEYIKTIFPTIVPEVKVGTQPSIPVDVAGLADPTFKFSLQSDKLPRVSGAAIHVALAGIEWLNRDEFKNWIDALSDPSTIKVKVDGSYEGHTGGVALNSCDFKITWTVEPKSDDKSYNKTSGTLNIKSLAVNYLVIFYP